MQRITELFIQNIRNLPIWVKQVITKEILSDLDKQLSAFKELCDTDTLFQYLVPKITYKGKQEMRSHDLNLSDGYYVFMKDTSEGENTIFDITVKNCWTLADTAKMFIRLMETECVTVKNNTEKNIAVAQYIAGKIKTGEFLKRIGKISVMQLEHAIRYQKELNADGRHIKIASILIKLGYVSDKGLDSLLLLKDEAKKRLPLSSGFNSFSAASEQDRNDVTFQLQREIQRLENENTIMKKRLKKLLNIES